MFQHRRAFRLAGRLTCEPAIVAELDDGKATLDSGPISFRARSRSTQSTKHAKQARFLATTRESSQIDSLRESGYEEFRPGRKVQLQNASRRGAALWVRASGQLAEYVPRDNFKTATATSSWPHMEDDSVLQFRVERISFADK
ncbi:hypothetical protein KM043_003412 [Ampulex compressa]|nr:hypothetical protein KM043_003412 [Ampulex compressa]